MNRNEPQNEKPKATLAALPYDFSVCRLDDARMIDFSRPFNFVAKTDEEISLVCLTCDVPDFTPAQDDGWRAFRVRGALDSAAGAPARVAAFLTDAGISVFSISTYGTDYILMRKINFGRALVLLRTAGYEVT